ncbi:MAG: amidohydrolase family protein [Rhizobium sp.]
MSERHTTEPKLLRVAQAFDGDRAIAPLADVGLVVGGSRILDCGPFSEISNRWANLNVEDFGNATAIPGLVDCHVHLTMPGNGMRFEDAAALSNAERCQLAWRNAMTHLRAGVTSMRDVGSHRALARWRAGLTECMPTMMLCCAPLTAPRGHMYLWGGQCSDIASIEDAIRHNVEAGSDAVKIAATGGSTQGTIPQETAFTQDQLDAIVRIGHHYGQKVTAHAMSIRSLDMCMAAGIDGVEHVSFLTEDGSPSYSEATGEALARSETVICATVSTRSRSIELIEKGEWTDPLRG